MLFNSLEFLLLFLPLVLVVSFKLRANLLLFWVCLSSFTFYALAGHVWFLIPMAVTTFLDYGIGILLEKSGRPAVRRSLLIFSLTCNLGLLAFFKYANFLLGSTKEVLAVFGFTNIMVDLPTLSIILPAGISFYTFQTISYVMDIYRRETTAEKNIFKFVGFVTFFPHLVAGPLTRHNQLIPQLTAIAGTGPSPLWRSGVYLFSVGLIKKVVVADRIATVIDPIIGNLEGAGTLLSWLALVGYSMQIYFDFSGYTDMAIGLGRLFGVELPLNFNSPYKAKDPSDFWRRWHITLSQWLRDYLYRPLGGNRSGNKDLNLMITMILGGLWHGANVTFLLWGFYHGMLLILFHRYRERWQTLPDWGQRFLTLFLVWMGWVFFRAPNVELAGVWYKNLFAFQSAVSGVPFGLSMMMIPVAVLLCLTVKNSTEIQWDRQTNRFSMSLAVLTGLALLMVNYSSHFIYFQF